jgi:hypothetical protein
MLRNKTKSTFLAMAAGSLVLAGTAFSQTNSTPDTTTTAPAASNPGVVPGHPRETEIDNRVNRQDARIQKGEEEGKISQAQGTRMENRDNRLATRAQNDVNTKGYVPKKQYRKMNKNLNHRSRKIRHKKQS